MITFDNIALMNYKDMNSDDNEYEQDNFKPSDIINEQEVGEQESDYDEILQKYGFEMKK